MRSRRRLVRKLHQRYLDKGVVDAVFDGEWRRRLFAAPLYERFTVDVAYAKGLPDDVAAGIRRYRLRYLI
ncbi:MAG TPA: hypothetical protein VNC50_16995, partial [Planctomycetia bacterium]|nr:hypothetical protein [Planctomycetia bacterium]